MLARAGCDVGIKDANGRTGRQVAEASGHDALAAQLRALAAEWPRAAQTAAGSEPEVAPSVGSLGELKRRLYDAAGQGDAAAVSRLLAAGADPNALVTIRTRLG